jgi:hypothetical protein
VFGVLRGLILIAMAYLLFTLIVPVKKQPEWVMQAWTLPLIQDTGDVLLDMVPSHRTEAITRNQAPAAPVEAQTPSPPTDLPRPRPNPAREQAAKSHNRPAKKSYGAHDRQGLDNLIQSTSGGHP